MIRSQSLGGRRKIIAVLISATHPTRLTVYDVWADQGSKVNLSHCYGISTVVEHPLMPGWNYVAVGRTALATHGLVISIAEMM